MNRREFIKITSLAAAWFAVNKLISNITPDIPFVDEDSILIYKIVHNKKGIQVCATMYGESVLGKRSTGNTRWKRKAIDPTKYDISTFEVLSKVPSSQANDEKYKHWKKLDCKGQYVPYNKEHYKKTGLMVKSSPGYLVYMKSDKRREDLSRIAKAGALASHKVLSEKNGGDIKNHMKMISSKITSEARSIAISKIIHHNKTSPKTQKQIDSARATGKKYGLQNGLCGSKVLKNFTVEQRKLWGSIGGKSGGAAKQITEGTHNFIKNSPNKIFMICPDGHITTKPSIIQYCRNRGLDPNECKELTHDEVITIKKCNLESKSSKKRKISSNRKLTEDQVLQIRGPMRKMKSEDVAKIFGISNTACKKIRSGETYSDLI